MVTRTVYDVSPDGRRWTFSEEGSVRSRHSTKDQAVNAALKAARQNAPSQLRIHRLDGSIESDRKYEQEVYPPVSARSAG
jgi:hypothetical protein